MRIGIHMANLLPIKTGRERVMCQTLQELSALDTENRYYLFLSPANYRLFARQEVNFHNVVVKLPSIISRRIWEPLYLYVLFKRLDLDVIHLAEAPVPFFFSRRAVATIYDLAPVLFPEHFDLKGRIYYRQAIAFGVSHSKKIITISKSSKEDLLQHFSADQSKVIVVHCGVDSSFTCPPSQRELDNIRSKYGLPHEFILYVGTLEPRKNLPRLLRAYAMLLAAGYGEKLVIAGSKGWQYHDIFTSVEELGLSEHVMFTEYVPDEDLACLYRLAKLFVYPSLYEGFGLPVLEAMASGVPVVTSNTSSLPEIVGSAGILVDPYDEKALMGAMASVLSDSALRTRLIEEGLQRSSRFTWRDAAEKTLAVYQSMI